MNKTLKLAMGADHGGFALKQDLMAFALRMGHKVQDCGTHGTQAVDYPEIARAVAEKVASGVCDLGIIVDGAGIGSAMTANKIPGVLAAACYDEALARNAREHNDANVLTLGAGQTTAMQAKRILEVFLSSECTVDRHQRRVQMIRDLERPSNPAGAETSWQGLGLDICEEDLRRIQQRVEALRSERQKADLAPYSPEQVAKAIDHTCLKPEASRADIVSLCREAVEYGFCAVCVNSSYVPLVHAELKGSDVKTCCVVGFPLGASPPEIKAAEARKAIREGAAEIDMVINVGALKTGDRELVYRDIRAVMEACKDGSALLKVILETSLLNAEEIVAVCELCMRAGADFVKTSTGFSSAGAKEEHVALMARTVSPKRMGVKASGGIRSYDDTVKMLRAGATRIGSSSGVKIVEEARKRSRPA